MKNLVNEDGTVMNYNKWVKGIADREFGSSRVNVGDMFKTPDQYPNTKHKQNVLPYPLSSLVSALGNTILGLQNSLNIVRSLSNNPLIKKESNHPHIDKAIKDLEQAAKSIESAANSVDNIQSFL